MQKTIFPFSYSLLLNNSRNQRNPAKYRELIKQVILYMTKGIDMTPLFATIVKVSSVILYLSYGWNITSHPLHYSLSFFFLLCSYLLSFPIFINSSFFQFYPLVISFSSLSSFLFPLLSLTHSSIHLSLFHPLTCN